MFLNLLCFLTCLLTCLLHQFLWPIFFLLDYLIYCFVSFALPTLTQLVHNLMSLFNSFLSFETPFPFPKDEALPFAQGFLLRSPFSKGEVFWFAIAFPFSKDFFFNFPFPNGLFFTISLPKKSKADLSNQFVTVQSCDNSWQRDYTNIWMQLWNQSYIFRFGCQFTLYINLYLRLEYIHTILSLQKVLVIYLCGFKNVDIIQLDKKLLFKTMLSIYTPWHVQNWFCFGIILFYFFRVAILGKRSPETCDCFGFFCLFLWVATLGEGNPESWDCFELFLPIFFWLGTLGKGNPEIWNCFRCPYQFFFDGNLGKGSCCFWDCLEFFFTFFFGRQALEKGVWRFQVALGSFFIFSWWQPLEKGIRRFEIALGLFYIFFGGTPWKRDSGDLILLWDYFLFF